jgi:hypothetical protein
MIARCTMLCGGEDCSDVVPFTVANQLVPNGFPRLRHGIPCHHTFSRALGLLDPA